MDGIDDDHGVGNHAEQHTPRPVRRIYTSRARWQRLRWLRRPISMIGVVAVLLGAYVIVLAAPSTRFSEEDALAQFRQEQAGSSDTTVPAAEGTAADDDGLELPVATMSPATPAPADATSATAPEEADADADAASAAEPGPSAAPEAQPQEAPRDAGAQAARPDAGVYSYAVTGGESLDAFGAERDYPDRATATVFHQDGGCTWRWRAVLAEEHIDETSTCSGDDGNFLQHSFAQTVRFLGVTEERILVCDPPVLVGGIDLVAGTASHGRCRDEDDDMTADVTTTEVERGTRSVGGVEVAAVRLELVLELSGSSDGRSEIDVWTDAHTGLVLELVRETDTRIETQLGRRHYQESMTMQLLDLEPRT